MALATTSEQGRHLILPMPNTAFRFNDVAAQLFSEIPPNESTPYKASLTGKHMPTLEWPDSIGGPWSSASKPSRLLDERRRNAIARWLQEESDDDVETDANMNLSSLPARHPMIAKVVMDRKRKELMLVSALSTPSLTNSSGGGTTVSSSLSSASTKDQSSSSHRRRRRRQHRTADDAETLAESPSARKHKMRKLQHHHQQQHRALELPVTHSRPSSKTKERNGKRRSKKALSRTASSTDSLHTAHIGCQCGIAAAEDKSTPMIQCNGCTSWYHLSCIGFGSAAEAPTEEESWFCFMCCEMASAMLTPSSLSSGLSVTPIFPRSAVLAGQQVRLSQGQLPVFAQPIETPSHYHRDEGHAHAFSSALALAPSPIVHSGSSLDSLHRGVATSSSLAAGRARASRVGWHLAEPGSPLQHKGIAASTAGGVVVSSMPFNSPSGRQWRSSFASEHGARLTAGNHAADEFGGCGGVHGASNDSTIVRAAADAYLRTPSPRLSSSATFTPSTVRRTRQSSGNVGLRSAMAAAAAATTTSGTTFGSHHRRESSKAATARDFDDIFSTPSRILNGSASWGQSADGTTGLRHSRQPSLATSMAAAATQGTTPWGLSTPTRHLMDAGFQSDYSAGALPSLVHSSADLDMGEFAGWHHHLQMSPSSNTRAASRARQQSINGRRISSVRHPMTPERGGGGFDAAASSSPFPKTPTFDVYHQRHRFGGAGALEDEHDAGHLDLLTADDFDVMDDEASDMPYDMRYVKHRNSLSANRRLSSLSHAAAAAVVRSPTVLSPSTSHTRTFATTKHSSKANDALQGALDLKAGQRNGKAVNNVKPRTRNASNDTMTGLGIGLELNDVLEWAA